MSTRIAIDDSNKNRLIKEYVDKMICKAEEELDSINSQYSGLGPNRRQQFKNALSKELLKSSTPPTPPPSPDTHIPVDVVPQLSTLGFTEEAADTILSLISLPENSTTEWWKQYNYAELLRDCRGWTVTLYGACSGTGDLLMILNELQKLNPKHKLVKYIAPMKKVKGDNIKGLENLGKDINSLGDDTEWQSAVWKIYIQLYWNFARNFSDKLVNRPGPKLTSPLTRGFMVDTALNHGSDMSSFSPILKGMKNQNETDEKKWFLDFAESRRKLLKSGFQSLDTSKTGDRCTLWTKLMDDGNVNLVRPIKCFRGYWGDQIIK